MPLKGSDRLNVINKNITTQKLINTAYPVFLKNTPIRSGFARSHTYQGSGEIDAAYPYAKRLNEGYSHQSPQGMTKPTIDAVRIYINKILGA